MRKNKWVVLAAILFMVLAACSQAPVEPTGSGPGRASLPADDAGADVVADTETAIEASEINGQVEAINGNIWTVDGRTVVIEEQTVGETAVAVGDTVSIQAEARNGGIFAASRVQLSQAGNVNDANGNANT
ncbi:MAG: DUF5666 domain-containing protein, partial [Anaerolineae bacterium]